MPPPCDSSQPRTELGKTLEPVLDALWAWDEGYKERMKTSG